MEMSDLRVFQTIPCENNEALLKGSEQEAEMGRHVS